MLPVVKLHLTNHDARCVRGVIMSRPAKPAPLPAAPDRMAVYGVDDIESEFLGIWLDVARLREKVLALISRIEPRPSIRGIKRPAGTAAATSPASPCNP